MKSPIALLLLVSTFGAGQHAVNTGPLVGTMAPAVKADEWIPRAPELTGKVVLLDFWATWCGPCIAQFPIMKKWAQRFGEDLVVIGITSLDGQTAAEVKAFLAKDKLPWTIAIDNTGITHKAFGVVPLPHTFLIDKKGVIRVAHVGGKGFADLLPELEKLIAER